MAGGGDQTPGGCEGGEGRGCDGVEGCCSYYDKYGCGDKCEERKAESLKQDAKELIDEGVLGDVKAIIEQSKSLSAAKHELDDFIPFDDFSPKV